MSPRAWPAKLAWALSAAVIALALTAVAGASAATGSWERAWGKDVDAAQGGTGFELCVVAASCRAGTLGELGGEMDVPSGVATDASGNVYVADSSNSRIQKFDPQGNFLRAWGRDVVAGGGTEFEICTAAASCKKASTGGLGGEMSFPGDVATDPSGKVYVVDTLNRRIQRFDSDGNWERAWGKDVSSAQAGTGFEICAIAANCKAGVAGGLGGEMNQPNGIAADGSGAVHVVDTFNARMQRFDRQGNFERAWGRNVDSVAPSIGFEVCTVAADCQAGNVGGLGGELRNPTAVATDASGKAYVADEGNHRIQRFAPDGDFERAWGKDVDAGQAGTGFEICTVAADCLKGASAGGLGGELTSPRGLAIDGSGRVYVAESGADRVQVFGLDGSWERAWGKDVDAVQAGTGFEVCVDAAGCKVGEPDGLGGEMYSPYGLAADSSGSVYLSDQGNERVQRFADPPPPPPALAVPPSNGFSFGKLTRNKRKGVAFLLVTVAGPGRTTLKGAGLNTVAATSGKLKLKLAVKIANKGKRAGKHRARLKRKGSAKLKARVTFVPTGGAARTRSKTVKLVLR
jgi:DNA-binding beta-propeller fold protein YncE